jgi:hypothetical protein
MYVQGFEGNATLVRNLQPEVRQHGSLAEPLGRTLELLQPSHSPLSKATR